MGKVNVVTWDGKVVAVDEELAKRLQTQNSARPETVSEEADRGVEKYNYEHTSAARAFAEGAADTATFGLYGKVVDSDLMRATAQSHPNARVAGEVAGAFVPVPGSAVSIAGHAGEAVAGAIGSRLVGRAVEGAALGVGGAVAQTNVTGDPLSIEAALAGAGVGAVLNVGVGALGDRIGAYATKARAARAEAAELEGAIATSNEGKALFAVPSPSLAELSDARLSAARKVAEANTEVRAGQRAVREFFDHPTAANDAVNQFGELRNTLLAGRQRSMRVPSDTPNAMPAEFEDAAWQNVGRTAAPESVEARGFQPTEGSPTQIASSQAIDAESARLAAKARAPQDVAVAPDGIDEVVRTKVLADLADVVPSARKALKIGNEDAALAVLQDARAKVLSVLPDAAVPEIPSAIGELQEPLAHARLPRKLEDLARMHADSISAVANSLSEPEVTAVNKLATELGVEVSPNTAAETLGGIHNKLKGYAKASDFVKGKQLELSGAKLTEELTGQPRGALLNILQHGSKLAGAHVARGMFGGGMIGTAMGWATGWGVGGMLFGQAGNALLGAKGWARQTMQTVFGSKFGSALTAVIGKSAPVTSVLGAKFLTGEPDNQGDWRAQALRRSEEVQRIAGSSGDLAFSAVQSLAGAPGDLAFKISSHIQRVIGHLAEKAPRDPGTGGIMTTKYTPPYDEVFAFAHRLEAALSPMAAIARAIDGGGHPAATETLWTTWPNLMMEAADAFAGYQMQGKKFSMQQAGALSQLFDMPLSGFQVPEVTAYLQGMYVPKPPPAGSQSAPQGTGNPSGRPPATGRQPFSAGNVTLSQSLQAQ